MISAIIAFAIALITAVAVTPLVRRFAKHVGVVDLPGQRRVHESSIPRLGGVAIVVAFFTPLLVLFGAETSVARHFFAEPLRMVGLVAGGVVMMALGVFDDIRGVRAWHKLWVQLGAATIAFACGFRIEAVTIPYIGNLQMGIFAVFVTALWIVAIVNAINLIDGLDGLAGGVAFFVCLTNFVVASLHGNAFVMLLSAALGGAVLGFLLFNFNPASIFMGDSGSYFLGFVLATTSILGASIKSSTTVAILVPLIAMGLPIMDTLFAMMRRFLERRPIFSPDRRHIHHRLLAMGITHRRAVLILYGLSILFASGAILIAIGRNWEVGGALVMLSLAVIGVTRAMGTSQLSLRRWRRRERIRPEFVEQLRTTVPDAMQRIGASTDVALVRVLLEGFAQEGGMRLIDLRGSGHEALSDFRWSSEDSEPGAERDMVKATFPVPAAGTKARLRFAWYTDQGEVLPECDILLQLVTDAVNARLQRPGIARERVKAGHLRPV